MDTLSIASQLVAAGFDQQQVEALEDVFREANRDLVTREDLERAVAPLPTRASLYRVLWLQTGGVVAAVAGLLAIVARLPSS